MNIKLYTVKDLKPILKLSTSQIYALIDDGLLRCHRLTTRKQGGIRVSEEQLLDYLERSSHGPNEDEPPLRHLR